MRKNTEQFITEATIVHNGVYDYTHSVYVGSTDPITVECKKHGKFITTPNRHLSAKRGCQKCSGKYRPSTQEWINDSIQKHGIKFKYPNTKYINNKTKVKIVCNEHGEFNTLPNTHRLGKDGGCRECAKHKMGAYHKSNTSEFIAEAKSVHGDKYDYSLVQYVNIHTKVTIVCKKHGEFQQTPASHTKNKCGCNKCSHKDYQGGFNYKRFKNHPEIKKIPAQLYLIETGDSGSRFIKIGITQKTLKVRMNRARLPRKYTNIQTWVGTTYDLFLLEQQVKRRFKCNRYKPTIKFDGHTECFDIATASDIITHITNKMQNNE